MFNTTGFTRQRFYLGSKKVERNIPATVTSGAYENEQSSPADGSAGNCDRGNKRNEYSNSFSGSEEAKGTTKTKSKVNNNNAIKSNKRAKSERYYISSDSEGEKEATLSQNNANAYENLIHEIFPDAYLGEIVETETVLLNYEEFTKQPTVVTGNLVLNSVSCGSGNNRSFKCHGMDNVTI